MRPHAGILVFVQFATLLALLLTGPVIANDRWLLVVQLIGVSLDLWAAATMNRDTFTASPTPRPGGQLISSGPYRYVRHPMYSGLLLITLPAMILYGTTLRWAIWLVFVVNLMIKLSYEEQLLTERYRDYADYRRATKKLIPFIY